VALFTVAVCIVAAIAVWLAWRLYKENRHLKRRIAGFLRTRTPFVSTTAPAKSAEQERAEILARQLEAVIRQHVSFSKRRVMGRGEFELFRAAMGVTLQPFPTGAFPFYVFPQVSLGQIIGTQARQELDADDAHRAINSKRCDLLIADRNGNPVAVLEYQGAGHDIGGTARRRDTIKRIALERAGVRYVEIKDDTNPAEMQQIIRQLLTPPTTAAHA
jgi:hypothetical protein